MKRSVAVCLSAAVFASFAASASAGLVIDQEQSTTSTDMLAFSSGGLAQSFQQAQNNVAGAEVYLKPKQGVVSAIIGIALYDNLPTDGGTLMTSDTATGIPGNWVHVEWEPVSVIPNTTLYLVFTSDDGDLRLGGKSSDVYPRGQAYANNYASYSGQDYAFRTYYESDLVAAPVPGAVLLGTIGLGTAGYLTRHRVA